MQLIQSARKAVAETLRTAGLDDVIETAESTLGTQMSSPAASSASLLEPAPADRIRDLGQPSFLIGFTSGLDEGPTSIVGTIARPSSGRETPERARSILMLGILLVLLLVGSMRSRAATGDYLILAVILGLIGLAQGPIAAAAATGIAALGWYSKRVPSSRVDVSTTTTSVSVAGGA
jgi:hypothetical protein